MKILGISGSLRAASFNTAALRIAKASVPEGVTMELASLTDIPVYNEEIYSDGFPPAVERFRDAIRDADALLIATSEYNYSIPGSLKNAIDWASRPPEHPFDGKPIALIGASAGAMGTARAQYHLRQVFVFLNGHVMNKPELMIPGAHNVFDSDGNTVDEQIPERIGGVVAALVAWTKMHQS
jgi:chromate reductase, NAD(P)H dehydrogenase (quinone)